MADSARPKLFRHPVRITEHVFDKLRSIDLGLGEFEALLDGGVVIEEFTLREDAVKELVLLVEWLRPLHLVVVVDDARREERIVTCTSLIRRAGFLDFVGGDDAMRRVRQR